MFRNRLLWVLFFILLAQSVIGQVTLEGCYARARANFPRIVELGLIERSREYTVANAGTGFLPRFSLSAKATWQSEVVEIPVNMPGLKALNKDQYQVAAEVNQLLYDGGSIKARQSVIEAGSEVERALLETDLYALKERVDALFFGVLLLNEQLVQNGLFAEELERNYKRVSGYLANGVAHQADLDAVGVEQVSNQQQRVSLERLRKGYVQMLMALTGETLLDPSAWEAPLPPEGISYPEKLSSSAGLSDGSIPSLTTIRRPELSLFRAQEERWETQKAVLDSDQKPKVQAFMQGAWGNPGLNMLKNEFSAYALGGVRLSWNLGTRYTRKNDLALLDLEKEKVETQKESFLYLLQQQLIRQQSEIEKLQETLHYDQELIALRSNIRQAAEAKLENGIINVTDLMREMTAEQLAIQTHTLHRIQLLQAQNTLKTLINN